jgi:glycosyltransferase involved in cell wall biosynthesis
MRIAAFMSHPIQHFAPLWQAMTTRNDTTLKVFYFSRAAVEPTLDVEFGKVLAWDIDLLAGYDHEFLRRRWPTRDPKDNTWKGLNSGLVEVLRQGWDAVYIAGWNYINNWTIARACRRLDIPCLVHSDVSILTAFDKSRLRLALKSVVVPHFLRTVAGALAIGDHSRAFLERYGAPPERVYFVPIPVDIERFRRRFAEAGAEGLEALKRKYGLEAGKRIITFSGKLIDRKRPLDLCEAMQKLGRGDVLALMVGEGPLRKEIESRGYRNVVVTGFVNQNEMPVLTGLGHISVMPSSYDAHPLSVTESLCMGIPVILSDKVGCYGPNDVFRDGENGLLYPCGDADALAERLRRLLGDDALHARLSRRARELAETQTPAIAADALVNAARAAQSFRRAQPAAAI